MNKDELYHFGILGQKWGIRRYQNPDGSLTPEGKERYGSAWKEGSKYERDFSKNELRGYLGKFGVKNGKDHDTIKKGTTMYRSTDPKEKIDGKRKYVSIDPDDRDAYHEFAAEGMLWNDPSKGLTTKTYIAQKDLKVAKGETVISHIIDNYGNMTIKQAYKNKTFGIKASIEKENAKIVKNFVKEYGDMPVKSAFNMTKDSKGNMETYIGKTYPDKFDKDYNMARNVKLGGMSIVGGIVKTVMKDHGDDLVSDFKKQNYDAMVDAEDWMHDVTAYPVVLLSPTEKDIKEKR